MALSIIGTPAGAAAQTITLPTHAVGDIILIGCVISSTTAPAKPAAAGTVPTFTDIDANTGASGCALRTAYAVATATNHTSGTWGSPSQTSLVAIVIRGQAAVPIGGHLESGGTSGSISTAPAVTMTKTDGTSILLEFHGASLTSGSFSAAPAGYTRQASAVGSFSGLCLNTKDSTTSDGSVSQTTSANTGYRGSTVEILALAGAATPVGGLLMVRQAVNRASSY